MSPHCPRCNGQKQSIVHNLVQKCALTAHKKKINFLSYLSKKYKVNSMMDNFGVQSKVFLGHLDLNSFSLNDFSLLGQISAYGSGKYLKLFLKSLYISY